jgi:ComF family protein
VAGLAGLASRALDLAFPPTCVGCGREGEAVCRACAPALDARLALPGGTPIGLPADLPEPLLQVEWCAPYAGVVRDALHALKYGGERRLAVPLGAAIGRRWGRVGAGGEVLVPVPVHRERAAQRGYDQAVLLAEVAGRGLGLPMRPALRRGRATIAQFELDRRARATNVAGAFELTSPAASDAVAGRWIVLVDDVLTTGATLAACATALVDAGAAAVSAVTVARER